MYISFSKKFDKDKILFYGSAILNLHGLKLPTASCGEFPPVCRQAGM